MDLVSVEMVIVAIVAMLTSVLSAVAGLGGGIILLTLLAQFFAPTTAIPIQGGIQLVSNGSRAWLLRNGINWGAVGRSAILMLPASFLGVYVATSIPEDGTRLLLGLFVLIVAWKPSLLKWRGSTDLPPNVLVGVGAASGLLNTTVGASGPFTSTFFKAVTVSHAAFVATAGASQVLAHLAKIIAFRQVDDFALSEYIHIIVVGAFSVILGSFIGTKLLGRFNEEQLGRVFKIVLTLLAIRLIWRALL